MLKSRAAPLDAQKCYKTRLEKKKNKTKRKALRSFRWPTESQIVLGAKGKFGLQWWPWTAHDSPEFSSLNYKTRTIILQSWDSHKWKSQCVVHKKHPMHGGLLTGASIKLPPSSWVNLAATTAVFVLYLSSKVTKTPGHRCSMSYPLHIAWPNHARKAETWQNHGEENEGN